LKSGGSNNPKPKKGVVSGVPPPRRFIPPVPSGVGGPGGSLYCFSLFVPTSYEPSMLRWQHKHKASIFACDGYGLYSNKHVHIVPGVETVIVDSDLKCDYGGDSGTALNAWIFIAVWKAVIDDGSYKKYDWVVKTDPDSVFFPDRLGPLLKDRPKKGYLNNCKYGMHGPIEVLSSDAVDILARDYNRSWDKKAPKTCVTGQDFGLWGEDMFLDQCLDKVLDVKPRPLEPELMCEAHCDCPAWYWCNNGTDRVSYHPFKSPVAYEVCMANALGGKPGKVFSAEELKTYEPEEPKEAEEEEETAASSEKDDEDNEDDGDDEDDADEDDRDDDTADKAEKGENTDKANKKSGEDKADTGPCKDAVSHGGSPSHDHKLATCAKAVKWAKEHGAYEHPEWYKDAKLSSTSSYAAFQRYLYEDDKGDCPRPCAGVGKEDAAPAPSPPASKYPPGPRAQTFYMYRAQSKASYPLENINTADLAGVMWYLHNEVISNTPRKYSIDRIKRFKVTVKNTWEFWNAHHRQFGAFMAYDAARCSTPVCPKVYHKYGFIVGCQVCDIKVARYLAKSQTNWNCEKGSDRCRAPLWYSLPGPCPAMGMTNEEINPNKVGLDVNKAKTPECIKRMPGGHCDKATGAPDCTYSYEEAGEILLNDLVGIKDYDDFWNHSYVRCANKVAQGLVPKDTKCVHQKEYVKKLDRGIGISFWDGVHDEEKCTARMNTVRRVFKEKFPEFEESLDEPPCEFDMYYNGEFDWKDNHTGAEESEFWENRMEP